MVQAPGNDLSMVSAMRQAPRWICPIYLYEEGPNVKGVDVDAGGWVRERRSSLYRLIE